MQITECSTNNIDTMPIGKSKISDMDFGSFENTIDKNIETDKASDKFDQQLQAYKDAGNSLTLAKSSLETATGSLQEAKENLNKVTDKADAVTKAIDSFIAKVRDIKFKAKVDDATWNRQSTTGRNSLKTSPNFLKTTERRTKKSSLDISMRCLI